jgi:hypothetical protein
MAKAGCARVAFPIVKGERGGVEATPGLCAAHLSLVKRKDNATRVCLERAMFYHRLEMVDLRGSSATRAQHISEFNSSYPPGVF